TGVLRMLARKGISCARTRGPLRTSVRATLLALMATALLGLTAGSATASVFSEQSCVQGVSPNAPNCTLDPALGAPKSLAVSPDGRFLYVGGEGENGSARLQVFGPNGSGGFQRIQCLTSDPLDATCTFEPKLLDSPTDLEVRSEGKNLYFGSHVGYLFAFARTTSGPNEGRVAPLPGRKACTARADDPAAHNGP